MRFARVQTFFKVWTRGFVCDGNKSDLLDLHLKKLGFFLEKQPNSIMKLFVLHIFPG